jgi:ectoine hydroxylase-related dioxygenase (phytanoyl-CoA dioxygenase family)
MTITRFGPASDPDAVSRTLERDGVVIIEGLLDADVVSRLNDEVADSVAAVDPAASLFAPILQAFHGPHTKQLTGVVALSRTFATDVMCHPLLLALCDRILLPSCARYQLNLGHLLQRGPGAADQWLHRDEAVWSDVPTPHPELQLATVIALVDFTADNGATRVIPGSHRWPDRWLSPAERG